MAVICRHESDIKTEQETGSYSCQEPVIICGLCHNTITDPSCQTRVNGSFLHTFANPQGQVFEIGCFDRADGCMAVSIPSAEFTWFAGYSWQIGVCSLCGCHIGWLFVSCDHGFHGLILEKLIFP